MSLQSCLSNISQQASLMKQCLSEGNLLQALKHTSNFLNELRSNSLSPKQYYELYMAVFDNLDHLSVQLLASHQSKQKKKTNTTFLADLYELVQYSGNIIPRLYMMIVIGTTYMQTNGAPTKEIMKDMIEMCRGVQHPIRGLFLRYYLSQRIKDLLPVGDDDDFGETVNFLIGNFIEMNKLWVRLQHQGHSLERELRYQERKELKILVGSNLVRLSQVIDDYDGGVNYSAEAYYKDKIFPIITEQIIQCRDHLAQLYLVDVLIQIFPDSFHQDTLDLLLDVFINLHPLLRKSELVATLIDRFVVNYRMENLSLSDSAPKSPSPDLFSKFWAFYQKVYLLDSELTAEEHSLMLQLFIKLSLTYEPDNYDNLNAVFEFATKNMDAIADNDQLWVQLLATPIDHFPLIKALLGLSFFHEFYTKLKSVQNQKYISLLIAEKVLQTEQPLASTDDIDEVFKYLLILIKDTEDLTTSKDLGVTTAWNFGEKSILADFLRVQESLCKVIHLVEHPDVFKNLLNLMYVRKKYLNKNPANIVFTYPTLIAKVLNKIRVAGYLNLRRKDTSQSELLVTLNFKNLSIIIDELYQHHQQTHSELVLKLYLNAAQVADQLKQESIAYEFFTQCFIVYEENLNFNSAKQFQNPHDTMGGLLPYQSVLMIANKLQSLRYFGKENYENLITKLTLYGSKLLKKQDQCRSVYSCAHLWWWTDSLVDEKSPTVDENDELYHDPKRVLECLQKALRVADSCIDPYLSLKLFLEILNRCLVFHIYGNQLIDTRYINGLIELIKTNIDNLKDDNVVKDDDQETRLFRHIEEYFDRTLAYIVEQQGESRFREVVV